MSNARRAPSIALPGDIKRTNLRSIMQVLRRGEPVTANLICEETGLSHPTAMKALQSFREDGIVRFCGYGNTTGRGGKRPELFVFSDEREILSASIWHGRAILSHCRLTEEVRDPEEYRFDPDRGPAEIFRELGEPALSYLERHGIEHDRLYGVAINMPGAVDNDGKRISFSLREPRWGSGFDVAAAVRMTLPEGLVFYLDNTTKVIARSLLRKGSRYAQKRVLTVFSGHVVSACLMDRGHVLNGKDALIGEIGHMIVSDRSDARCICGKRGCLDSVTRIDRLRDMLREKGVETSPDFTVRDLFERSAAGDPACRALSLYLAHYFAVALHNAMLTYDQEIVVFQGHLAWADEAFDRALREELRESAIYSDPDDIVIEYDRRSEVLLAAQGSTDRMKNEYFSLSE